MWNRAIIQRVSAASRRGEEVSTDLHCMSALGKMPGAEETALCNVCQTYQGLQHSELRGTTEDHGDVWLLRQIHHHGQAVSWHNDSLNT